jgi:glycosyltransferase involved in cell wall biosynthesis
MGPATELRVLGVTVHDVSDWVEPVPEGKWSQFFRALSHRFELVGVVRPPEPSQADHYLNLARSFHPRKHRWKAKAGFNLSLAMRTTQQVQREMERYEGSYDLIMLLQTLCGPGLDRAGVPYAIYTDNTMALTQRLYPDWAPLSAHDAARWMEFEADVCRSASAVFTFSEFARGSVINDYGCLPDSVVAVGAGANQLLGSLGVKDYTAQRAVFVGTDFARKGGPVLLDAWPIVRSRAPEAELIIAGPDQVPRTKLPPGVSWVGQLDRAGLAELYRSASVFVLPSLFEPWGFVFFEAMGYGLACIGTSCCAMPEIIDDGVTGRLAPRGEAEPLADVLTELLTDSATAAMMGHAAHAHVKNGNTWTDVLDRVAAHLHTSPSGRDHAVRE